MDYWVYILQSQKDNRLYVGMTRNFQHRFEEHNNGRVPSTRARRPLSIVHTEIVKDRKDARVREKYWKSGAGREKIQKCLISYG